MDAVSYIFIWHFCDDRACPTCMRLNGRTWTDQDIYQATIWDPIWGDVYDLNAGEPIVHRYCRCYVEVIVKIEPMEFPELQQLAQIVEGDK